MLHRTRFKSSLKVYLKKVNSYDNMKTQKLDWSEYMLELEDNKKELQELFNKLEEIGESL